jgi:hypothetical protein
MVTPAPIKRARESLMGEPSGKRAKIMPSGDMETDQVAEIEEWPEASSILEAIKNAKETGVEMNKLSRQFSGSKSILAKLEASNKIVKVGNHSIRYITKEFENAWKIEILEDMFRSQTASSKVNQKVVPKVWMGLDGKPVSNVQRACLETIITLIFDKPGIYEARICTSVALVMSPVEVREVCDVLVERGCCTRKYFKKAKKMVTLLDGLFDNDDAYEAIECTGNLKLIIEGDYDFLSFTANSGWFMHTAQPF